MSFWSTVKKLLPVNFVNEAEKVAPEVQAEIDKLLRNANAEVAELRKKHSIQTLKDTAAKDLADLDAFYERIKKSILDAHTAKVEAAKAVLPPVNLPVATPPSV